jgi:hypothetical protein
MSASGAVQDRGFEEIFHLVDFLLYSTESKTCGYSLFLAAFFLDDSLIDDSPGHRAFPANV